MLTFVTVNRVETALNGRLQHENTMLTSNNRKTDTNDI